MVKIVESVADRLLSMVVPNLRAAACHTCSWNCYRPCGNGGLRPCCCDAAGHYCTCAAGCI